MSLYTETFDDGPGGWGSWSSNSKGPKALQVKNSAIISRSPWWIDYNHAPPGGGYMHLLFALRTTGVQGEHEREVNGANRFVAGNHSTDFAGAKITFRLAGELITHNAELVLLIQGCVDDLVVPWLLIGQPLRVEKEWTVQTIHLTDDPTQWKSMGARHDRGDMYAERPLEKVLRNLNGNILLALHPLHIEPMEPLDGDMHLQRPEKDYPVWRSRLPEGYVKMDEIRIEFSD